MKKYENLHMIIKSDGSIIHFNIVTGEIEKFPFWSKEDTQNFL